MGDWKTLLAVPRFRALWIALLCANLGSWSLLAALPILVADRFGAGTALVLSLAGRILPKIALAPVSGTLLRRFGAPRVAGLALLGGALLTAALPWCEDFVRLQFLIAGIGALDVFIMPGLLSLRGAVTPEGLELAGNSLCSMADRLGKTAGPAIGGLAVLAGFAPAFAGFALATGLGALAVARLPRPPREAAAADPGRGVAAADDPAGNAPTGNAPTGNAPTGNAPTGNTPTGNAPTAVASHPLALPREFLAMLRGDRVLVGLLVCAVSYMVMIGGLRPFLFWANRDWFGAADTAWTGLMAAQGAGAMIGALVAGAFNRALLRRASAYALTMVTGLMEGACHLLLLLCPEGAAGAGMAMAVLALAGIPELVSTATWFTALQQRLSPERQGVFLAFSAPMWDCAYAVGVMSAGLRAGGAIGLAPWWALLSLTATLPIVPLMLWHFQRGPSGARAA